MGSVFNPVRTALFAAFAVWLSLGRGMCDEFQAGTAVVDINPRVLPVIRNGGFLEAKAERIDDPLHARCLALCDGRRTLVLAIVDSCMIPRELCDEIKQNVSRATGLPTEDMLVAATHTHSAPGVMNYCLGTRADPEYPPWLVAQVAAGMIASTRSLEPARIGWTVVDAPEHTYCRRWLRHPDQTDLDPFGDRSVRAMMHPGYLNPAYLGPAGPVDSQMVLLSVQTRAGRPLCLLANYSMHYFGADQLSADYFGDFARELETKLQTEPADPERPRFLGIMSQGTSGDQHWMNYGKPQRASYSREQYARELAALALGALPEIEYRQDVSLGGAVAELTLRRRTPDARRLEWARGLNAARGEQRPRNLPEVYAEQAVWLDEHPETSTFYESIEAQSVNRAAHPDYENDRV